MLTDAQRQLMMDHHLGLFRVSVKDGTALQHGGYLWFPTNNGSASLNCSITDFSLGVQVALIHNSPVVPAPQTDIVTTAFNAAWEPRELARRVAPEHRFVERRPHAFLPVQVVVGRAPPAANSRQPSLANRGHRAAHESVARHVTPVRPADSCVPVRDIPSLA